MKSQARRIGKSAMPPESFDHLSSAEREIVGDPSDYDWNAAVRLPARSSSDTVQFSVRVPRSAVARLRQEAVDRNISFSDIVREAITARFEQVPQPAPLGVQLTASGTNLVIFSQSVSFGATTPAPQSLTLQDSWGDEPSVSDGYGLVPPLRVPVVSRGEPIGHGRLVKSSLGSR
jgi:hypothetical protein